MILALLLLAMPEHGATTLMRLARPPKTMPATIRKQADFLASHVLVTNIDAPSPISGPAQAPTMSYRVVANPKPRFTTNVLMSFDDPTQWLALKTQSFTFYQIAWTTNLAKASCTFTQSQQAMPKGWEHYMWTRSRTNLLPNTNPAACFIVRGSNWNFQSAGDWSKRP